jgi:hypothetical protein
MKECPIQSQPGMVKIKELKCHRNKVEEALKWLIENSPGYEDVIIDEEALNQLPEDGFIDPHVLDDGGLEAELGDLVDLGPAPEQHQDVPVNNPTGEGVPVNLSESSSSVECQGVIEESPAASGLANRVREELNRIHSGLNGQNPNPAEPVLNENNVPHHQQVENGPEFRHPIGRAGDFVKWKDIPFFFSMAFPTLFMPSTVMVDGLLQKDSPADFSRKKARHHPIPFFEWATHLMTAGDGRFAAHPVFKFVLLQLKNRESALSNTSFAIKQILQTPNIKIKIEKKFNKILLYGKNKTIGNSTNIRKFTAIKIF